MLGEPADSTRRVFRAQSIACHYRLRYNAGMTTQTHWTVSEVATEIGITTGRIRQILNERPIRGAPAKATKIGHYWVFTRDQRLRFKAIITANRKHYSRNL